MDQITGQTELSVFRGQRWGTESSAGGQSPAFSAQTAAGVLVTLGVAVERFHLDK